MKIGIDARFFGPDSKGLGRYTQKLIAYLEKIDSTNEYVIFLRRKNFNLYKPKNKNFTKVVADYRWYSFAEQIFFPFLLYKYKCDVVHFPHFNVPILYFRKFIVTIHDLILLRYPTQKASTRNKIVYKFKFLVYRLVIFCAVIRAKHIIAVSKFTKEDICSQYPTVCDKVFVIYESAEIDNDIQNLDVHDLKKYGIIQPYMLYVGNAYPHKNLNTLITAFDKYKKEIKDNIQLVIIGCDDYFYQRLQKYIEENKVNNVIILYTVSDALLQNIYKNAHFFVFPSLYEGFGLPPLEAQFFGVPVLSSDRSCMVEILSEEGALYVDVDDLEDFVAKMNLLASDEILRAKLIKVGKQNVKKYSWLKMAQETNKIYKNSI